VANHSIGVVVIVVLLCVGDFVGGHMPDAAKRGKKKLSDVMVIFSRFVNFGEFLFAK
jgi:hypothetical protein